jgi:transposase InsO family protein
MTGDRSSQNSRFRRRVRGELGWEFVHVAVDDYSRFAYAEVQPDERALTALAFLRRAIRFFARYGIRVEAVITDNGPAYSSIVHARTCRQLRIRHLRIRPRRPQTNGKACVSGSVCRPLGRRGCSLPSV